MNRKNAVVTVLDIAVIISFVMNEFANIIAFYLSGNRNETFRKIFSWSIMLCVTAVLGIWLLIKLFREKQLAKKILICLVPVLINGTALAFALFISRGKTMIIREFVSFIVYCVPLACGAVYILTERRLWTIVAKVKYVALLMIPFYIRAVIYFWGLTPYTDPGDGYGGISYLGIGYSASIIYSVLICDLLWMYHNGNGRKSKIGLVLAEIVVCTGAILFSGSRGVLLSWAAISIIGSAFVLIKRKPRAMSGTMLSIISLVVFAVITPADNAAISRQLSLINDIKQGSMSKAFDSEEKDQILDIIEQQSNGVQGMTDITQKLLGDIGGNTSGASNKGQGADFDKEYQEAVYGITNGSVARAYLFQLAIREAGNKPFTGMGVMGYQQKYAVYPHNILLEVMADFGIPLFVVFTILCAMLLYFVARHSIRYPEYAALLILLSGQIVKALLSGDVYVCPYLVFAFVTVIGSITSINGVKLITKDVKRG